MSNKNLEKGEYKWVERNGIKTYWLLIFINWNYTIQSYCTRSWTGCKHSNLSHLYLKILTLRNHAIISITEVQLFEWLFIIQSIQFHWFSTWDFRNDLWWDFNIFREVKLSRNHPLLTANHHLLNPEANQCYALVQGSVHHFIWNKPDPP